MQWTNRTAAGLQLAARLDEFRHEKNLLVLGLPRGGVIVAAAVAEHLNAPLGVLVVRKIGVPGHEELAMGAVASGNITVQNDDILRGLGLTQAVFEEEARIQREELRRREELFGVAQSFLELAGRTVFLIDDGLATGATMRAAVNAVRKRGSGRLVVAVPVAARVTADHFRILLRQPEETLVCLHEPRWLDGVGRWYEDFRSVTDEEVRETLWAASQRVNESHAQ